MKPCRSVLGTSAHSLTMTRLAGIFLAFLLPLLTSAQAGSEQLRTNADALFTQQRFAEAMPLYSQLVSLSPADRELNYRFGTTLLFVGEDKEKAIGHLKFATESPAITPSAWYWLGRAYHLNYRFTEALGAYQRYRGVADKKTLVELPADAFEDQCRNGQKLLSKLKEITVRNKMEVADVDFFRFYDLSDIGGKIVVAPDELKTNLDKRRKLRSLVYLPDKGGPIYFSSYGKDGSTGLDIYRTELLPDGKFAVPVKLSGFINTSHDEDHAFMHPDGRTFYFSSKGHSSMGGYDVFRSRYDKGMDAFGRPENMDFAVNTPDDDILYIVDSEQKEACFASGRSSAQGKLHVYRVATTQTPLIITVLRGTFASEFDANDRKARIVVEDAITREQVADVRTDINGSYVLALPRSGKFRFMVECGPSGRTHTGTVDVPRVDAPKAYRQELTLTKQGDMERLMIRNYFDEPLDGDIITLALDEIKRRARLDVSTGPEPVAQVPVPEEPKDVLTQAGFAGDVDLNDVQRMALEDATELNAQVDELGDISAAAYALALEAVTEAEKATKEAETLVANAAAQSDEDARNATMVQAAMQRQRARDAELRAQAAYRTARSAEDERLTKRQEAAQADKLATDVARTTTGADKNAALPFLTALKERLDTKSGPTGRMDFAERTRRSVTEQEQEVARLMLQANAKRIEESELVDRMNRLLREQAAARTQSKKDELGAEIATYQEQLGHLRKESETAFSKARVAERETAVLRGNAGLTRHLLDNGASSGTTLDPRQAEVLQQRIEASRDRADALAIDERFDARIPIRATDRESRSFAWGRTTAENWAETERAATQSLARNTEEDARRMSGMNSSVENQDEEPGTPRSAAMDVAAGTNDGRAQEQEDQALDGTAQGSTQREGTASSSGNESAAGSAGTATPSEQTPTVQGSTAQAATQLEQNAGSTTDDRSDAEGAAAVAVNGGRDDGKAGVDQQTQSSGSNVSEGSTSAVDNTDDTRTDVALSPEQVRAGNEAVERIAEDAPVATVDDETSAFLLENRLAEARQLAGSTRDRAERDSLNALVQELEASLLAQRSSRAVEPEEVLGTDGMTRSERNDLLTSITVDEARRTPMRFDESTSDQELITAIYGRHNADQQSLLQLSDADERAAGLHGLELMLADSIRAEMARQVAILELSPEQAEVVLPRIERLRKLRAASLENAEQLLRDRQAELAADQESIAGTNGENGSTSSRTSFAAGNDPINDRFVIIEGDPRNIYASSLAHRSSAVAEAVGQKNGDLARIEMLQEEIDSLQFKADRMSFGKERDKVLKSMDRKKDDLLITRTDLGQRSAYLSKQEWKTATDSLSGLEKAITRKGAPATEPLLLTQRTMKSDAEALKNQAESMRKSADRTEDILVRDSLYRGAYELELRSLREVDRSITVANYLLSDQHTRGEILEYSAVAARVFGISEEELLAQRGGAAGSNAARNAGSANSAVRSATSGTNTDQQQAATDTSAQSTGSQEAGNELSTVLNTQASSTSNEAEQEEAARGITSTISDEEAGGTARAQAPVNERDAASSTPSSNATSEANEEAERSLATAPEPLTAVIEAGSSTATAANADLDRARAEAEALALREESALDAKAKRSAAEYEALLISGSSAAAGASGILKDDGSAEALELVLAAERIREQNEQALVLSDRAMQLEDSAATVRKKRDRKSLEVMALRMRSESDSLQRSALLGGSALRDAERAYVAQQEEEALRRRLVKFYYLNSDEQSIVLDHSDHSRYFAARTAALAQYDAAAEASEAARVNRELGEALKARAPQAARDESEGMRAEREAGNAVLLARSTALLQRADSLDDVSRRLKSAAVINESQAAVMLQGASEEDATALMALEMRARRTEPLLAVARDQAGEQTGTSAAIAAGNTRGNEAVADPASSTSAAMGSSSGSTEGTTGDTFAEEMARRDMSATPAPRTASPRTAGAIPKTLTEDIFELRPASDPRSMPIAMDAEMPEGIVFKVQIGAFRNAIPEETFRDMTPVMGENVGGGLVRYTAGLFTSFDQAAGAKDKVRDRGYGDAFVVAYRDGVRIPLGEAMRESRVASVAQRSPSQAATKTVPGSRTDSSPVVQPGSTVEPATTARTTESNTGTAQQPASQQGTTEQVTQQPVTQQPVEQQTVTQQPSTAPVTAVIERPSSVVVVAATPEEEVSTLLAKYPATATEIVDRFVPVDRAADYYNVPGAAPARQVETIKGLFFTVQVGVYSKPVALDRLFNITPLNSELTETGKIRYTTGMFLDSELARVRKDGTVQLGVKDAFVTAYLNGKRIPMREAAALLERFGPEILAVP